MSSNRPTEQILPPTPPVAVNAGRYGPRLWEYKGKVMEEKDAALAYETDRANHWQALGEQILAT